MKIGEIAEAAGVTTSRIRFYEKRGIIEAAPRDDNGYRSYSKNLVERLKFIEVAQQLGFTLKELAKVEPNSDSEHPVSCEVAIEALTQKIAAVDELIREAKARKKRMQGLIVELRKTFEKQGAGWWSS